MHGHLRITILARGQGPKTRRDLSEQDQARFMRNPTGHLRITILAREQDQAQERCPDQRVYAISNTAFTQLSSACVRSHQCRKHNHLRIAAFTCHDWNKHAAFILHGLLRITIPTPQPSSVRASSHQCYVRKHLRIITHTQPSSACARSHQCRMHDHLRITICANGHN